MLIQLNKPAVRLGVDFNPKKYLLVCSHERSGTHFLMNSISLNSDYTTKPYLTFDQHTLGDIVNFYFPGGISRFFDNLDKTTLENRRAYLASIIKSHHSHRFFRQQFPDKRFKFIYIYRNPVDTLLSFWRFILRWDWDEGTKTENPFEFVKSAPEGYLMRHQHRTMENYFVRWAYHQLGWFEAAEHYDNIMCISYNDLKHDYANEIGAVLEFISQQGIDSPQEPSRENFIKGVEKIPNSAEFTQFRNFIAERLTYFPKLEKLYKNEMRRL